MPWEGYLEKRRVRDDRRKEMAMLARELPLLSREARLLQAGNTDRMAHVMLHAAHVFVEELSAAGRNDLLDSPGAQEEPLPGARQL